MSVSDEVEKALQSAGFETVDLTPKATERDGPVWDCKIGLKKGTVVSLPGGCDAPMREAVERVFFELTGLEADFCFSGWGGELDAVQQEIVDEEKPSTLDVLK